MLETACPCLEYEHSHRNHTSRHDEYTVSSSPKKAEWPQEAKKSDWFCNCIKDYKEPCEVVAGLIEGGKRIHIEEVPGFGAYFNPKDKTIGIDPGSPEGYTFFRNPVTGRDEIALMVQNAHTLLHEMTHAYVDSYNPRKRRTPARGDQWRRKPYDNEITYGGVTKHVWETARVDEWLPVQMEYLSQTAGGKPARRLHTVWSSKEKAERAFNVIPWSY